MHFMWCKSALIPCHSTHIGRRRQRAEGEGGGGLNDTNREIRDINFLLLASAIFFVLNLCSNTQRHE